MKIAVTPLVLTPLVPFRYPLGGKLRPPADRLLAGLGHLFVYIYIYIYIYYNSIYYIIASYIILHCLRGVVLVVLLD